MGNQKAYESMYGRAAAPTDLPWHREQIPPLLERAVREVGGKGRALDVGCGTGVFSVWLAKQGFEVTALDFVPKALDFTRERAAREGVRLGIVQADVFKWDAPHEYDLVLDSGCLHNFSGEARSVYKRRLLSWLGPRSRYVLIHFSKRNFLDWSPIGPRRIVRGRIEALFEPELKAVGYETLYGHGPPGLLGTKVLVAQYLFQGS